MYAIYADQLGSFEGSIDRHIWQSRGVSGSVFVSSREVPSKLCDLGQLAPPRARSMACGMRSTSRETPNDRLCERCFGRPDLPVHGVSVGLARHLWKNELPRITALVQQTLEAV